MSGINGSILAKNSKRCSLTNPGTSLPAVPRETVPPMQRRIDNRTRRDSPTGRAGGVFTAFGLAVEADPLKPGL